MSVTPSAKSIIPPQWVHLLPIGHFSGLDGRGTFQVNNPQKIIDASLPVGGRPIPVDYNHLLFSDNANHNPDATAAGWVDRLETREDGIWGHVEWTPKAAKMISDREWRYLSPAIVDRKNVVVKILGVALVNRPNLLLTDLFDGPVSGSEVNGSSLQASLQEMLGLSNDASENDILAALKEILPSAKQADSLSVTAHSQLPETDQETFQLMADDVSLIRDRITVHAHAGTTLPDKDLDAEIKSQLGITDSPHSEN